MRVCLLPLSSIPVIVWNFFNYFLARETWTGRSLESLHSSWEEKKHLEEEGEEEMKDSSLETL